MDTQNCYQPIINGKEKVINAFVEDALNCFIDGIMRSAKGATYERMVELEQEKYLNAVDILTEIYYKCPPMKHIKDAINKPDFIWDSLFIETIGKENVIKWFHNPLNADIDAFKEDNTIYDEDHPFFSYIFKVLLYERYVEFLLEDQKKYKTLIEIEKNIQTSRESARNHSEADVFIADMEQKLAERKAAVDKEDPKEYTFGHNLKDDEIETLTECVNKVNLFRTKESITKEQLKSIFDCNPETILRARSNRLVAHFFDQLSIHHYITNEWQAVVAKNQLILAPRKNGYINQNDLSVAVNYLRANLLEEEYTTIEEYIKELKALRKKEKTEKKGK